jgi:hypothetical protein
MLCHSWFTPGNEPWYSLNRRLSELQSHTDCLGEKKNLLEEISLEEAMELLW